MEKFNNTTIFTGYLKQLLNSFNLPKYRIYTKKHQQYFEQNNKESPEILETITREYDEAQFEEGNEKISYPDNLHYIPYIKNGLIKQFINGKWVDVGAKESATAPHIHHYSYGMKILNYTKNLQIKNNTYDSYTHEYLGDYLRFKRDYNNINLMPLYNCFSNKRCDRLEIKLTDGIDETTGKEIIKASFDTNDAAYKIYMIPVKLFQKYTIAIDCASQIELCCGLYGRYQDKREKFKDIIGLTYQKVTCGIFAHPFIYDKLLQFTNTKNKNLLVELAQNECDLKLFIKVPNTNTSTIIVLEGDYLGWNDSLSSASGKTVNNKAILNFENIPLDIPFELKTPLQLLRFNTGEQHPFADRLVEYLVDNVITSDDIIANNIRRVQKAVKTKNLSGNNRFQYIYLASGFEPSEYKANFPKYIYETETYTENGKTKSRQVKITILYLNKEDNIGQYNSAQKVYKTFDTTYDNIELRKVPTYKYEYKALANGAWDNYLNYNIYEYITNNNDTYDVNHDIFGFVDKDVEKNYQYKDFDSTNKKYYNVSISNTELDKDGK